MRYMAERIRPNIGTPSPGTSNLLIREYKDDRNALRFMHKHLAADHFQPGQYRVSTWPESSCPQIPSREVGTLYKKV